MKHIMRSKYCFCIVSVIIFTLWFFLSAMTAEASESNPVKLKVTLLPFLSYAPFFIAQEEGYFSEQGLDVEFVKIKSSDMGVPLLLQGEVDIIAVSIRLNLLNALARGGTLKIVADKGHVEPSGCASAGILARRSLVEKGELDNPTQLRGRRISVGATGIFGYVIDKLLNSADLTFDDVVIENLPFPARPTALETGAIDLVIITEPWITRIVNMGHTLLWKPVGEITPELQFSFIIYGSKLLDENPEAGRQFMIAYLKGVRQYDQGKTERNLDILVKHTDLTREFLQEVCWPPIHNDGHVNFESINDFQSWALEKGLLDSPVTKEQFWDNRFIDYANQQLETTSK